MTVAQDINHTKPTELYREVHWSRPDGLRENGVNVVIKDAKGFMWIGSRYGSLSRFDGSTFKKYLPDRHDKNALDNDFVIGFVEDSLHNIWVGTFSGVARYDLQKDAFTTFKAVPDSVSRDESIIPISARDDLVYCLESASRIITFNIHSLEKKTLFDIRVPGQHILGGFHANYAVLDAPSNSLWMMEGSQDSMRLAQISIIDGKQKRYSFPCQRKGFVHRHGFEAMVHDPGRNSIWLNAGDGLIEFTLRDHQFHPIHAVEVLVKEPHYDRFVGIDIDLKGRIWFATRQYGILIYDPITEKVSKPLNNPRLQQVVSESNLHIYCDRDGIVWTTDYYDRGIYQLIPYDPPVVQYYPNPNEKDSLSSGAILTIVPGNAGSMWIGTDQGLNIFDPHTGKFKVYREKDLPGIRGTFITPLYVDTIRHKAWLTATYNPQEHFQMAVYEMDLGTRECKRVTFRTRNHQVDSLNYVPGEVKPFQDVLLLCHDGHGLFKISRDQPVAELIVPFHGSFGRVSLKDERYLFISNAQHGIPNQYNLTFENKNGEWVRVPHMLDSITWSYMFYNKTDRTSWVVMKKDLVQFDDAFNKVRTYTEADGYDSQIRVIVPDSEGNLWFTNSKEEIGRLNPSTGVITKLSYSDGYKKQEFDWISTGAVDFFGNIYFGSLAFVALDKKMLSQVIPSKYSSFITSDVYIKSLAVNHKPVELTVGINSLSELNLRHNENSIGVDVGTIDFHAKGDSKIRYRLKSEGSDGDWQYNSVNSTIRYEGLSPGSYRLVMQGSNANGEFNSREKILAINIDLPYWETWWFRTLATLSLLGVLVWARKEIIHRERLKSNLALEHLELEKAKEVDKVKSAFFTNISHEFRTPLTLIKGPVENMLEAHANHPKTIEQLKMVQRNSDLLLKLINQLLDLAKLESGTLTVEKTKVDLSSFLTVTISSFSSLALQKNIELTSEIGNTGYVVSVDKDKLETILINLINNAIKFTPPNGKVIVRAQVEGQNQRLLNVSVSDNGIGIPPDQHDKIFERFHQVSEAHKEVGTGIGLSLVKELIILMGGKISVSSEPGKGSDFNVTLPIELVSATAAAEEEVLDHPELKSNGASRTTKKENHSDEASGKPLVLVVEDNADLRKFIIDSLGQDYHYLEAADGKQGLEIAFENTPDLIVSDVMMPEIDGITMAGKLKKDARTSHIPLILLTAKTSDESKISGLSTGADDYLTKPFNKQELLLKVRNSIALQVRLREKVRLELLKESPRVEVQSADEKFLLKVKETILARLSDEQLSVESLAEEIALSRSQLLRKVTALTGVSVNELIRTFRLQKAAQLLEQNWGPVTQVAYEVGFSNLSYFSKVFKEQYGVLPSEYPVKVSQGTE